MKVKYNQDRPGKVLKEAPSSMEIFDDNGTSVGEVEFRHTPEHGMEIIAYSYSHFLSVGACPHTKDTESP